MICYGKHKIKWTHISCPRKGTRSQQRFKCLSGSLRPTFIELGFCDPDKREEKVENDIIRAFKLPTEE